MGNKAPDTLIAAAHGAASSRPDVDNLGISQYHVREGAVYLSGAEVINTSVGPFGAAYWAKGWQLQTTNLFYGTAPEPWQKSALLQAQPTPLYTAGQAPFGSAPTSGIYTGVHEDGCS